MKIKFLFFSVLLMALTIRILVAKPGHPKADKPNILFILVDDLGYNDVGFMGSRFYETPHLDKLAARSTVFTSAYANAPVCSPSRASLMTGQFTARNGITDWIGAAAKENWRKNERYDKLLPPDYERSLKSDQEILPQVLKKYGYTTFIAGKWHLGGKNDSPAPYFDEHVGGVQPANKQGSVYFAPYRNAAFPDAPPGEDLSLRLAKETSAFIRNHRSTNFFAYLSFYAVHGPIQTTRAKWAKYRAKAEKQGIHDNGFEMGPVIPYRLYQDNPVYAGLIESVDEAVGMVLQTLEEEGLLDHTIIVFTSDNGGVTAGDSYSTNLAPLKGGKGTQWEGGLRVPLLVKLPQGQSFPKKIETAVIGSDLFPTLLELAGLPLAPEIHVDGKSLAPLFSGGSLPERSLIWHYPHYGNQGGAPSSIIRKGPWKLIHYYEDGENSLYNISGDPSETYDRAKEYPDLVASLYNELNDYLHSVNARYPEQDPLYDPKKRQLWEQRQRDVTLSGLELGRKQLLHKDYQPNDNWWGSEP